MVEVASESVNPGVDEALSQLRATGGRVTTPRRLLLERIFASPAHRTAEELAAEVQGIAPDVHLSTVYRNLEEFERLGLVSHVHLGHGPAVYHRGSDVHGHLVCDTCGETIEAPKELFGKLAKSAADEYGFLIDVRHFAVPGQCTACAAVAGGGGLGARQALKSGAQT